MPASIAESITFLVLSRSSRLPKLLHPRPSAETMRPVLPNARLIMGFSDSGLLSTGPHSRPAAAEVAWHFRFLGRSPGLPTPPGMPPWPHRAARTISHLAILAARGIRRCAHLENPAGWRLGRLWSIANQIDLIDQNNMPPRLRGPALHGPLDNRSPEAQN